MLNIPEQVKELFSIDSVKKELRISFPNGERDDILSDQIVMNTFSFRESLCSRTTLQLGLCEASYVQFDVVGVENIKGYKIKVDCMIDCTLLGSAWCDENATITNDVPFPYYTIPYGIFNVDTCAKKSGKTKNRRTIKAYTREALDDWELPNSIKNALNCGWYTPRTQLIPLEAILKATFPEAYSWEYTTYHPATATGGTLQQLIKFREKGTTRWNTRNVTRYHIALNISIPNQDGEATGVIGANAEMDADVWAFGEEFINDVKAYADSNGYEVDFTEFINRVMSISYTAGKTRTFDDKGYMLSGQYKPKNAQVGENIIYHGQTFPTKIVLGYQNTQTISSGAYVSANGYSIVTMDVPCGFVIPNLPDYIMPPKYVASQSIRKVGYISYFVDRNFSGGNLERKYESSILLPIDIGGNITSYYCDKEINIKDIIEGEAELQGKLGKFNRYGGFEYISLNSGIGLYPREDLYPSETLYPQEPNLVLPTATYSTAEWEDQYNKPFDKITVEYTNTNDETISTFYALVDLDDEYYNADDYQSYSLTENYFIKNQKFTAEQIAQILETVANNIKGIRYMPSEVDMQGLPYIEAGDYIEFLTDDSGFQTIVLENSIEGEMYLKQTIASR